MNKNILFNDVLKETSSIQNNKFIIKLSEKDKRIALKANQDWIKFMQQTLTVALNKHLAKPSVNKKEAAAIKLYIKNLPKEEIQWFMANPITLIPVKGMSQVYREAARLLYIQNVVETLENMNDLSYDVDATWEANTPLYSWYKEYFKETKYKIVSYDEKSYLIQPIVGLDMNKANTFVRAQKKVSKSDPVKLWVVCSIDKDSRPSVYQFEGIFKNKNNANIEYDNISTHQYRSKTIFEVDRGESLEIPNENRGAGGTYSWQDLLKSPWFRDKNNEVFKQNTEKAISSHEYYEQYIEGDDEYEDYGDWYSSYGYKTNWPAKPSEVYG